MDDFWVLITQKNLKDVGVFYNESLLIRQIAFITRS